LMAPTTSYRKPGQWLLSVAEELRQEAETGAPGREAAAMRSRAAALEVLAKELALRVARVAAQGRARRAS
jgi:hypothetical protein